MGADAKINESFADSDSATTSRSFQHPRERTT